MGSNREWDVLPRDPALPQLRVVLDSTAMAAHFRRHVLPTFAATEPARYTLEHLEISHVRYRPGRNCAVAYRAQVIDSIDQRRHDLRFHGRAYPADGAASRHARASAQTLEAAPLGPPLHLLEALDMVLWAFPNERKLSGLGAVLDNEQLSRDVLPEVVASHWGPRWRITRCMRDIMHYVPEHALTVRVQALLRHQDTGELRPVALFGKCHHDDTGARTFTTMRAIATASGDAPRIPAALCYQPRHRLLWQEALHGVPLAEFLADDIVAGVLFRQAGAQLAALHATRVSVPAHLRYAGLIDRIGQARTLLCGQGSAHAALATTLAQALQARTPAEGGLVLLHGDLHAKNLLVGRFGVGIIDLDGCAMGPAQWDLGSFIAALLSAPLEHVESAARIHRIDALLQGYGAHDWNDDAQRALDWCVACALLIERAMRSVSRLKAGRMAELPALLAQAQRVLTMGWRGAYA